MHSAPATIPRMGSAHPGFTLVEALVATAIVTVGLTAVAAGFQQALHAAETGREQTTALFLAEQRLEQVKARALQDFDGVTTANFPGEDPVAGFARFRRVVEITPGPAGIADTVRVDVTVIYRPLGGPSPGPRAVTLITVLSRRW
jgi:prepilin-type N-terminal cleavage/methylation domain-containing protein